MLKGLFILLLAAAIFGTGAYWTYELFMRPEQELKAEKQQRAKTPDAFVPPDPSLPEFQRCLDFQKDLNSVEARKAFEAFLERYPNSVKADEARDRLGALNAAAYLSPVRSPEKQEYVVKSGDVLNKIAGKFKSTPELIMRSNNLNSIILRIGQRLWITPASFSVTVRLKDQRVLLFNQGKFFKQYRLVEMSGARKGPTAPAAGQKLTGKISEKIAWGQEGQRITFADKGFQDAGHWVVFNLGSATLYSEPAEGGKAPPKPPVGLGLSADDMKELAALLRKGDPVTIEP